MSGLVFVQGLGGLEGGGGGEGGAGMHTLFVRSRDRGQDAVGMARRAPSLPGAMRLRRHVYKCGLGA